MSEPFELNEKQEEAAEFLRRFIADPLRPGEITECGVFGYAGTGKTSCVSRVLADYHGGAAMTAPTHKAVGVLALMGSGAGGSMADMHYGTIHSLLGLKPQRKGGKQVFLPDPRKPPPIRNFRLLIVDECSMLDVGMMELIRDACNKYDVKVVYMGDPLQLPPVEEGDGVTRSPSFDVESRTLSEIMRYGGAIEQAVDGIRGALAIGSPEGIKLAESVQDHTGSVEVTRSSSQWFGDALSLIEAGEDVKLAAFTNRRVEHLNDRVRRHLYGADAPDYLVDERLVAVSSHSQGNRVVLFTEEPFVVESAREGSFLGLGCWELDIVKSRGGQDSIRVLKREHRARFGNQVKYLAAEARKTKRWAQFWQLKEAFAEVRPPYSCTIHKLQGSSVDHTFVDQREVLSMTRRDPEFRARLLYVGYSRAAKALHVFH
jgi:exodeoxyribonuclease-5